MEVDALAYYRLSGGKSWKKKHTSAMNNIYLVSMLDRGNQLLVFAHGKKTCIKKQVCLYTLVSSQPDTHGTIFGS